MALVFDAGRVPFFVFAFDALRGGEADGEEGQPFAREVVALVDELLEAAVKAVEAVGEALEGREKGGVEVQGSAGVA